MKTTSPTTTTTPEPPSHCAGWFSCRKQALALLFCLFVLSPARADLPTVRFDRLTPLGGAAGSTVELEIAGADLEGVESLLFDHPGFKATFVKDRRFRLAIAQDVPPGTYDVRLLGRFGVSNPRLFRVSHGLTDVAMTGQADAQNPQPIPINSAVHGVCRGNREDVYRFPAKKGQRLVVECQAGKLDSAMDATLALTNLEGKALVSNGGYNGRDPLVDFLAPLDGDYLIKVHDLSYRGGHPYLLILTDRPHVATVFPRAVQVGKSVELTVLGRNLGKGAKASAWSEFDLPLDESRFSVKAPADVFDLRAFRFVEHPTDHSALPTAATCTVTGFQVQPKFGDGVTGAQNLLLVDTPVTLEAEPNDAVEKAQPITLPAVVSGRFDQARDTDWYEFETGEAGAYSFEVYCERIAGRADPYLVVQDAKGNRLTEFDDFGHRIKAFDAHLRDPSGTVNLAAKTKYRVLVQDRYSRGGPRCMYVLTVNRAVPDFFAACIHSQNPGPAGTTVLAGSANYLDIVIHQTGGFNGPITLTAEGLPAGVRAQPTVVTGTSGVFVLWADAGTADWAGTVKLFATAKVGDRTIRREVRPYTRVWSEANIATSRPTRDLVVAVRDGGPFALGFAEQRVETRQGQKLTVKLRLERNAKDFKDKVAILPLTPGPLQVKTGEIAAGKDEAAVEVDVPAGTPPGEYRLSVLGQAQVPYSKDPKAAQKPNVLVSVPARPLTVVVIPKK